MKPPAGKFSSLKWLLALLPVILVCLALASCNRRAADERPQVAFVTNGIASFWVIAEKGAEAAGQDFDVRVRVRMPPRGVADQQAIVEELLTLGVDGIAISPIDPDNQEDLLNMAARRTYLITQDSDAPNTERLCYVGMDNYTAGRMCGELVKEALPDGGEIVIFVGRLDQLNARQRRQGVIDELMDRSHDPTRYDAPGEVIRGERFTILDTAIDRFDFARAKSLAQESIARYPNLNGMVGLFAYNPPKMLEAVEEARKLDQIKIIGFDEEDETLQGILDGTIHGTVVQNPYQYGYESVRILAGLARGDSSALPDDGFLDIPARVIRRDNVQEFWDELRRLTAGASLPTDEPGADADPAMVEPDEVGADDRS